MAFTHLDAITVAYFDRRSDDNWRNLPIWDYQGDIPYAEGKERGQHWTKCFQFYVALWYSEMSKKKEGEVEWVFLADEGGVVPIYLPYHRSKEWFGLRRDESWKFTAPMPTGPPYGVAGRDAVGSDEWKIRHSQDVYPPVITQIQIGTSVEVYHHCRRDPMGTGPLRT